MSELEKKTEAEVEDFTDELSDKALDQAKGKGGRSTGPNLPTNSATRRSTGPR